MKRIPHRTAWLRSAAVVSLCVVLTGLGGGGSSSGAEVAGSAATAGITNRPGATDRRVRLAGRVVCVPEHLHELHKAELPSGHDHLWGFRVDDGHLHVLLRGRYSEAIFVDERVRAKQLVLLARIFPGTQVLEVTAIHTLREGVEHDLYYYCDVCSIKSVSPEICACCREPVRLVEKALTDKSEHH